MPEPLIPDIRHPHLIGRVRSGDAEIFYRRFTPATKPLQEATPVLIVHGLSYFSYDWIPIAGALASKREVVAIDMRGFGQSSWSPARDYGLRTLAGDIVAVLDHLGWARAVLMGHSMGGRVCLCTAAWHAARAASLVCLDFAPDVAAEGRKKVAQRIGNQPDFFASVDEALAYHGHAGEAANSLLRTRYEAFLEQRPEGLRLRRDLHYRDNFRETLRTGKSQPVNVDLWALLAGLHIPSLFVRGASSDMFAPETLAKVRAANPLAQAVEIEGSHDLAGDNPAGVIAEVSRFLASQ